MGALAGRLDFHTPPAIARVDAMAAKMARRGPDGAGRFAEGPFAIAHRRRAVGPIPAAQPLVEEDAVVALDGWIYDHLAVARRLGRADPAQPDVSTVLFAWRTWGPDWVHHLDGSFTVAIWARREQALYLFRDRVGTRPLFLCETRQRLLFASELPGLLVDRDVPRDVATEHLAEYLSFRVVHAPRTLLRGVTQLEPGHRLRFDARGPERIAWFKPAYARPGTPRPSDGDLVDRLQQGVEHAVARRVVPGADTAIYLSGGLGSTAIAAAALKLHLPMVSWTMGFADDPNPETPFAGRVARLLGLDHHEWVVGSAELAHHVDETVEVLGHPNGNPAAILQLVLAREVGRHHRVVLSGDGGEELFGGRMLDGLAGRLRLASAFAALPKPARRAVAAMWRGERPAWTSDEAFGLAAELGGTSLFRTRERTDLLADAAWARPSVRRDVLGPFYEGLDTDPINAILHAFQRSWLSEGSLVRADRTASAAGLDVRFPLLDSEVMAMAAALPGDSKLRRVGGSLHSRWPLRAMLEGVLPPPLVNRPKRGLPAPLDGWLGGAGRLFLEDRFARLRANRRGWWKVATLDRLHREVGHTSGAGLRLWSLFLLEAWLDRVVEAP